MKMKLLITLLLSALHLLGLCGCGTGTMAQSTQASGNALGTTAVNHPTITESTAAPLTKEQAQEIVLKHAGFTADQVKGLRAEYEIDDGIPRFKVQFRQDRWEYDYEINAQTGDILSYDRDD